jgi:opine dehydrogenase
MENHNHLRSNAGQSGNPSARKYRVGVIGSGNSAHALAAWLSSQGHTVTMYARDINKLARIRTSGRIVARGKLEGTFPVSLVTDSAQALCANADIIFVATLATAYSDVARQLSDAITREHRVIVFSGKLCGSLEMSNALRDLGKSVPVLETDALFACRLREDGSIWIRGHKQWTLYSGINRTMTREFGPILEVFFPTLEPADHLIQRGLTDFGALAHPVITLANMSKIDRGESFFFYYEGLSDRTIALLEAVEAEFRAVARAYGVELIAMKDLLDRYYGCDSSSLLNAMTSVPNYRHSVAPATLNHRYLSEDVHCTLIPLRELARKAEVATPTLDGIIHFTSLIAAPSKGETKTRSLDALGWSSLSQAAIMERVTA